MRERTGYGGESRLVLLDKAGMMNIQTGDGDTFPSQKGKVSALP